EMLEQIARGCGFTKAVDAHHRTLEPHVLAPIVARAGLHRYLWDLRRKNRVPVLRALAVENAGRRHGNHAYRHSRLRKQFLRAKRERHFRAGSDEDGTRLRRVGEDVAAALDPREARPRRES